MNLDQCSQARICRIQGTLKLLEVDHVLMGRLELPKNSCVNVSLPAAEIRRVKADGPQLAVVEGRVFPAPTDPNIMTIMIEGRRVGWNQCGDFYVFVP